MGDLSSSLPLPRLSSCADSRECEPERLSQIREEVANVYLLRRDIIFRFLLLNLRNRPEAEDLTQETFMRLYVHYASGRSVESPLHWMLTVARNLMIDRTRRLQREVPCIDNVWSLLTATQIDLAPSAEGTIITEERSAELNRAISGLRDLEKDCLTLRLRGLAFREIADALGIPMSAAVTQTSRAIAKIRRLVNE